MLAIQFGRPVAWSVFEVCSLCKTRKRHFLFVTIWPGYEKREWACFQCGLETFEGRLNDG